MSCYNWKKIVEDHLNGSLEGEEWRKYLQHLKVCSSCKLDVSSFDPIMLFLLSDDTLPDVSEEMVYRWRGSKVDFKEVRKIRFAVIVIALLVYMTFLLPSPAISPTISRADIMSVNRIDSFDRRKNFKAIEIVEEQVRFVLFHEDNF